MKACPVRRALHEKSKAQPAIIFHNAVVYIVAQEQEEMDVTVVMTKLLERAYHQGGGFGTFTPVNHANCTDKASS